MVLLAEENVILLLKKTTPSPGAVCPAIVTFGETTTSVTSLIMPPTANVTMRPGLLTASLKDPAPASLRLVTTYTSRVATPLAPRAKRPKPSASGKASVCACKQLKPEKKNKRKVSTGR